MSVEPLLQQAVQGGIVPSTNLNLDPSPSKVAQFFGASQGGRSFGLASGIDQKFTGTVEGGDLSWKGISGLLQFFHKWPMGFVKADWGRAVNQVFWNILLFVIIPGAIYGSMIKSGSLSVPDGMKEKMAGEYEEGAFAQGFYFALMTLTTLGFGDITPSTVGAQVGVMFHIIGFILFNFIWAIEWDPTALIKEVSSS